MQLVDPDILADGCNLSVAVSATGLGLGLLLWLLGWWGHRFWIVLTTTLAAGVLGLYSGPEHGVQRLAAGLLLAVAAGAMALALVRVLAFAAGGLAAWLAVLTLAPAWEAHAVCFLAGGLVGILLFRVWTMALTSFAGALLMTHAGLCLADRMGKLDAAAWAAGHAAALNWVILGAAFLGLVVQFLLDRYRLQRQREKEEEERWLEERRRSQRNWWNWLARSERYRRAG
jgi:MFS family permease